MIEIKKINDEILDENYRFRTFLKIHADEKQLDKDFKELHEKYFKNFDCTKCRNCCREIGVSIQEDELNKICKYYNFDRQELKTKYLDEEYGEYTNKNKSCPFLKDNNECQIKDCLPRSCIDYPYTDKEDRLDSLITIVQNSMICPVVYQILEDLKIKYHFKSKR